MQRQIILAWGLLLLIGVPEVFGCTAEYESIESLVKKACLILEVEPVDVSDVLPSSEKKERFWDNPEMLKNAQAVVRIIRVVKGQCKLKSFTLIGGPYRSCAPYECYIPFEKGKRVFLILDRDLPDITQKVVIRWRGRVFWGEDKSLRAVMDNAKAAWQKNLTFHQHVAPDSYAEAQKIIVSAGGGITADRLQNAPYSVLACLGVLLVNPEQVPSVESEKRAVTRNRWNNGEFNLDEGVTQYTRTRSPYPLPQILVRAIEAQAKAAPQEIVAFNCSLLKNCMVGELLLPEDTASMILQDLVQMENAASTGINQTGFSPYKFSVQIRKNSSDGDKRLLALSLLLALADDEPDSSVHKAFIAQVSDLSLDPELFVPYLTKHQNLEYMNDWGKLSILLAVPHLQLKVFILKAFAQEHNTSRLDRYFVYFLKLGDMETAGMVLDQYRRQTFIEELSRIPGDKKKERVSFAAFQVGKFRQCLGKANCTEASLVSRVDQMEQQIVTLGGKVEQEKKATTMPSAPQYSLPPLPPPPP